MLTADSKFKEALRDLVIEIIDELGITRSISREPKQDTVLRVKMPNGEVIHKPDATHTMEFVISLLGAEIGGIEKLAEHCPYLVSTDPRKYSVSSIQHGKYFLFVGGGTQPRVRKLLRASKELDIELEVRAIPKP